MIFIRLSSFDPCVYSLNDSALESEEGYQCAANQIKNMPDNVLIKESGKLIVIMDLLDQMKWEGHRCLVFSQSRKMLDIIHQLITNRVRTRSTYRSYKIHSSNIHVGIGLLLWICRLAQFELPVTNEKENVPNSRKVICYISSCLLLVKQLIEHFW